MLVAMLSASLTANAAEPMACNTGPVNTELGGTTWQLSSCSDGRSLVFVTAEGNPAMPFVFMIQRGGEKTRIAGEGNGDKTYTAAAFEHLKTMSEADFDKLVIKTMENNNDRD
ncbi:hypothetical protein [Marinihelvus fidelis]|uniref:hypothetical protein n=1 Tax=Marinihelvus fidelis TaxID=2613842 RepID=UPI001781ED69|nr:hypothetical protein [Marinihelvus fidelis]